MMWHWSWPVQYMLNYGGGLVAGDAIRVTCSVGPGCTVALATQGSTKVSNAPACQMRLWCPSYPPSLPPAVSCFPSLPWSWAWAGVQGAAGPTCLPAILGGSGG